jgi:hypothetical protein
MFAHFRSVLSFRWVTMMWSSAFAGLLVGFFIGSLDAGVISSISAIIVAIISTVLGGTKLNALAADNNNYEGRVGSFALAALIAFGVGTWIRVNHVFEPSVGSEVKHLREAGFSDAEAREIALFSVYKIVPKDRTIRP